MEQGNSMLTLDLLDIHNILINVEDHSMSLAEAVQKEAVAQGIEVSGAVEVVLPEKHLYLKESIEAALKVLQN